MAESSTSVPEHCPGTQSEAAGKASACAGCPNQQICSSGVTNSPDPSIELIKQCMLDVQHKILILSGKGGVGKSTVTALLSRTIAFQNPLLNVAVLDIDICGPSQPRVLGVADEKVHQSGSGWSPVYVTDNLSLMSVGLLLSCVDDAVIWRGPKKNTMIRQFLSEVDWGKLEYLLIDSPPGTSDEHLSIFSYLSKAGLTGAVIVTTPQEVALLDVRKEIDFCRKVDIKILGVIENMSSFICPTCQTSSDIFPATTGGASKLCSEMDIPFLGRIPLDPVIAKCCDEGRDFINETPYCISRDNLIDLVKRLTEICESKKEQFE